MRESETITAVLRYLGARDDCRVWRQNTGDVGGIVARLVRALCEALPSCAQIIRRIAAPFTRGVSFGLPGAGDVSGLIRGGRRLEIEIKSDTGRQSEQQRRFQAMIESLGGLYLVVRNVSDLYSEFPPP